MPCLGPLTAYKPKADADSKRLVFRKDQSHSGIAIKVPCGQCLECRLDYARDWAIRCMHEARLFPDSAFVTLTYDDETLPRGGTLVKDDVSSCMKRLHNRLLRSRKRGIRYYACGEYGDQNGRPHYHALVFDYAFPDRKYFSQGKRSGERYFTSDVLSEVWPDGHCLLGDVTFDSAMYVAGYVTKKIRRCKDASCDCEQCRLHVARYGERVPEFSRMSKGIGKAHFERFGAEIYAHDSVIVNGSEKMPPRYYDVLQESLDPAKFEMLKKLRRRKRKIDKVNSTQRRLRVREVVTLAKLNLNRKGL